LSNPRLVATSGYLNGTVWPVRAGSLFLGRYASNQVEVSDVAVSRKHCAVSELSSGALEIADLDSHNGTSVKGIKVSRRAIEHGDGFVSEAATLSSSPARMTTPS
jgi:pSer/pThr/pTyr-binding forkhead associated (FHA) protein